MAAEQATDYWYLLDAERALIDMNFAPAAQKKVEQSGRALQSEVRTSASLEARLLHSACDGYVDRLPP